MSYCSPTAALEQEGSPERPPRRVSWGIPVTVAVLLVAVVFTAVAVYGARQHAAAVSQFRTALARHNSAMAREQAAISQLHDDLTRIASAHAAFNSQMNDAVNGSGQCSTVTCMDETAVQAANANGTFLRVIQGVDFPVSASPDAVKFEKAAVANRRAWLSMAQASSFSDYGNRAARAEKSGKAFDDDYSALGRSLSQVGAGLTRQAAVLQWQDAALRLQGGRLNVPVNLRTLTTPAAQSVT